MAERKVQVPFPLPTSPLKSGYEVVAIESTERWTEVNLEDGTILRVKPSVLSAIRIDNEYDAEGNPMYAVKVQPAMTVVSPDHLKKPKTDVPVQ
jgi:hypothetical protein